MKKSIISVLLAFVLLVPVCFAFSACKKETTDSNGSKNDNEQNQQEQQEEQKETEYTITLHTLIDLGEPSTRKGGKMYGYTKTQDDYGYVYTKKYTASDSALVNDGIMYINVSGFSDYYKTILCKDANLEDEEEGGHYAEITPDTIGNREYWVKYSARIGIAMGAYPQTPESLAAFATWAESVGFVYDEEDDSYFMDYVYSENDISLESEIFNGYSWVPYGIELSQFSINRFSFTTVKQGINKTIESGNYFASDKGKYTFWIVD